jgi:hypothetical protein
MIDADVNVTSTFERASADIDDLEQADLDRLVASLDYLDGLAAIRQMSVPQ